MWRERGIRATKELFYAEEDRKKRIAPHSPLSAKELRHFITYQDIVNPGTKTRVLVWCWAGPAT